MPESAEVYTLRRPPTAAPAPPSSATYASAEALQKVLDMGVVEGSTLAINQIDDLLAA